RRTADSPSRTYARPSEPRRRGPPERPSAAPSGRTQRRGPTMYARRLPLTRMWTSGSKVRHPAPRRGHAATAADHDAGGGPVAGETFNGEVGAPSHGPPLVRT